ncbi:non-hydrolyzing UDP-N-acetylglucosamine 2-epimerase [uncultured Desulfosarcina sp.]|uniref:non-hydrolyzing UDP-N-acetylglucosamine 2-epimerase n=1 Tax=uncultured Desulfosarcina sp. TaxID=218289 RepID=UPI0029C8E4CC|nr:UDP-N-acetylglucosamine 2-epimerase (non-hydrolyzing) [uncultured Desulfosarcina sp.]
MKIHLIAAARPNFMKIAPLFHALKKEAWADPVIVHTGQHYDINMSDAFFRDLELPDPHIHLGIGSGSHAEQTGSVMIAYEKVLQKERPALVVVVGDVNSTMACTIAASKLVYPSASQRPARQPGDPLRPVVAHLEAGLRSKDRSMPEEINRLVTDTLADILWTPSADAVENLLREGVTREKINNVGNIMIDSLEMMRDKIEKADAFSELGLTRGGYGLITLHRPSNVDSPANLKTLCRLLVGASQKTPLVFPIHPRTRKNLDTFGLMNTLRAAERIILTEPMNYIRFMNLVFNCHFVITDSGGIQEETTYLGIPCLTMRPNTERPVTVDQGTNQLCTIENLQRRIERIVSGDMKTHVVPELWDGHTAGRIVDTIRKLS